MDEELLAGGHSAAVVRVRDTVRRPAGSWTDSVDALLRVWRAAGITEVPEPLGRDEQGRQVLGFLPGEVATHPLPDWLWAPPVLDDAARLLRRLHDASVELAHRDLPWQLPTHPSVEVVCHNDVAPYNLVFTDGRLTGVIDVDMASPGSRVWDLAYLAYRLVPFAEDSGAAAPTGDERDQRLTRLIAAYDWPLTRSVVLTTMVDRLVELAAHSERSADHTGMTELRDHAAMYLRDARRLAPDD